ncbi:hypothetical protein OXT66_03085 [Lentilactobacillus senioris]|uniref:hypothetical protein n=1 Tax=Lentilactobacillus senioris TaxID=931534 RepID=UPI002280086E|nr:hypothetical protein [Lentilactobacillus senioris]MCY9806533.1 hypothetical protein [Lentilactobacillus senioris]
MTNRNEPVAKEWERYMDKYIIPSLNSYETEMLNDLKWDWFYNGILTTDELKQVKRNFLNLNNQHELINSIHHVYQDLLKSGKVDKDQTDESEPGFSFEVYSVFYQMIDAEGGF